MNEEMMQLKTQVIQILVKQEMSIDRYKRIIKDIKEIKIIDVIDGCKDKRIMEQLVRYYNDEYSELKMMYEKLKSLKYRKLQLKALIEAIETIEKTEVLDPLPPLP